MFLPPPPPTPPSSPPQLLTWLVLVSSLNKKRMLLCGTKCFSFVHQGIQLCGIYFSCVKPATPEASELKKIFDGVCSKVRVYSYCNIMFSLWRHGVQQVVNCFIGQGSLPCFSFKDNRLHV